MAVVPLNKALVDKAAPKKVNDGCEVEWSWVTLQDSKPTSFCCFLQPEIFFSFPYHKM